MSDPLSFLTPPTAPGISGAGATPAARPTGGTAGANFGDDFASAVRSQLEKVSQMQAEADQQVQKLMTGQSENITEVFTAARKAEVAFSLLMQMRNKLVDAYQELQQLRV